MVGGNTVILAERLLDLMIFIIDFVCEPLPTIFTLRLGNAETRFSTISINLGRFFWVSMRPINKISVVRNENGVNFWGGKSKGSQLGDSIF